MAEIKLLLMRLWAVNFPNNIFFFRFQLQSQNRVYHNIHEEFLSSKR